MHTVMVFLQVTRDRLLAVMPVPRICCEQQLQRLLYIHPSWCMCKIIQTDQYSLKSNPQMFINQSINLGEL